MANPTVNQLLRGPALSGEVETIRQLLAAGADPNAGQPLFSLLLREDSSLEIAKLLLDAGASTANPHAGYGSPLAYAAERGKEEIVRLLLERGAPVDGVGGEVSPLVRAFSRGRYGTARLLIERGADIDITWSGGSTPLSAAVFAKDPVMLEAIITHPKTRRIKPEVMRYAVQFATVEMIAMLIDAGASLGEDGYGGTPLLKAAEFGRPEVVKYLLERGADVHARDYARNTPLLRAAAGGHVEAMKLLLNAGAELSIKNAQDLNALMLACQAQKLEAVRFLVERGITLNEIEEKNGYTALTMAWLKGADQIVQFLTAHGAHDRQLRRPPMGSFLPITDCDICAYLLPYKELEKLDEPDEFPLLETIHKDAGNTDRYATKTDIIRRCPICNTHYYHSHFMDTEDAFASPATLDQHMQRFNMLGLLETLTAIGKHKERADLEARRPALLSKFRSVLKDDRPEINPNVLPYVVESVIDDLILRDQWDEIEFWMMPHPDPRIVLETVENLLAIYHCRSVRSTYPHSRRDTIQAVHDKLLPWLQAHVARLEEIKRQVVAALPKRSRVS